MTALPQSLGISPDALRYAAVGLDGRAAHVLRLEVQGRLRLFAFTFG